MSIFRGLFGSSEGAPKKPEVAAKPKVKEIVCGGCNRSSVQRMEGNKYWCSWCNDWALSVGMSGEGPLEAMLIIFNRDFSPRETFINSILAKMTARGRPYRDWMTKETPMRVFVNPNAQDPTTFTAAAMAQFRMLIGDRLDLQRLEHATFDGSHGISGVIVTHWKNQRN